MPADFFQPINDHSTPPCYRYFDGNQWRDSSSGMFQEVVSPIDGKIVGKLPVVTTSEIDAVIKTAKSAQQGWGKTPLHKRVQIMHLAADWVRQFEHYLTSLLVVEIGKSESEAKSEILRTADLIDYYADEVQAITGATLDSDNFPGYDKGRIAMIERVAYGTVLCIAPFNYPVNLAASKIAPALLMGNSVVIKPPTQGGISGIHLTQIFLKAGVPPGVLTCVTGGGDQIGDYLVSHPGVGMIAFTGSSDTGRHIAQKTGMIPLLFECGGNNPVVVFPDADMQTVAREVVKGAFSYAGQRCTGIKYVIGTPNVLAILLPIVLSTMKEMVSMGDPRSPATKLVGPVISQRAAAKVQTAIDESLKAGARAVVGGKTRDAYVDPTVLTDVTPEMPAVAHEVFGPVVSFITVKGLDQATNIINASSYGLQASVFTRDEGTGISYAKGLDVGTVQINGSPQRGPDHFPFLGIRHSGLGVQGVRYSLEAMSRLRSIVLNKPE